MPTETSSPYSWFRRYKDDVTFLGLLVAGVIGGGFYIRHAEYMSGMTHRGAAGCIATVDVYGVLVLASLGFMIWMVIRRVRC
jgi:hypothetical protein